MGQTDALRVQVQEGAHTYVNTSLAKVLLEIDLQVTGANSYQTITRTSGYISNVSYYSDALKTKKIFEHQYARTINRITSVTAIYYNANASEDSRVIHTITRDASNVIIGEASPFSTTENTKI